ncbi:MAG: hypothetical protein N2378_05295 [Chloroflexaceae bacterium]|nr:hypothetical protein [Chloroflexaceae bacterium]
MLRRRGRAFLARCRRSAASLRDAVLPPYPLEPLRASRRSLPHGPPTARQARRAANAKGATSTARVCGPGVSERTIRRDRPFRCGTAHREALKLNAAALMDAHNHPYGSVDASPKDILVTRQIVAAGKLLDGEVLDHLILSKRCRVSLREKGLGFSNA